MTAISQHAHAVEFRSLKKGIERGALINLFAAGHNGKKTEKSGNDGIGIWNIKDGKVRKWRNMKDANFRK